MVHLKIKDHPCDQCEYATSTRSFLKSHKDRVHRKIKEHFCDECGYSCSAAQGLSKHRRRVHLKEVLQEACRGSQGSPVPTGAHGVHMVARPVADWMFSVQLPSESLTFRGSGCHRGPSGT